MTLKNIDKLRVNNSVVEMLEDALQDAKKGLIVSSAIAYVRIDNTTSNNFTNGYPMHLIGELLVLQREITDSEIDTRLHRAGGAY